MQFALQNVNQTWTIRFGIAICRRANGIRELFLVSRDWKHDLKNEAATRAWLHNLKVPPNYPVWMLADVHTVFTLRDYAVHGIVGVNLRCSLVISAMKLYQSSYTATCLGASLQHTTIVPFAPDRLQHKAWTTVVIIYTTHLTFIVRPFSIRNIYNFPHTGLFMRFVRFWRLLR